MAGADWQTAPLIHLRKKQAAASTVLMMSKEGKELGISQVFSLQAQTEGLEVGKTQFPTFEFQFKCDSFRPEKELAGESTINFQSLTYCGPKTGQFWYVYSNGFPY